ncbi:MAG TPA: cobaltochelatase subunit CobN [Methylomusa anaerophila]|uniref:Aerobic cobaltochelatase subunit CobN n=1 Tax=Methylomusa anaerophila TaxID=1930071 RepID=A0A348AL88_9FIRM|nr:cobaltochelatase subunit CobN [Methylomusa anaerophila]BBB91836.1 aerobic cobaltochelatase subunit CobN [Methylomusa anaerophila]HML88431.1 cobaltochelatase subunit CobN [Methylomusa anaerophila]
MKIGAIVLTGYMPALLEAAGEIPGLELKMCGTWDLENPDFQGDFFRYLKEQADVLLLSPPADKVWEKISAEVLAIVREKPAVAFGYDPGIAVYNTVKPEIALTVQRYLTYGGRENTRNAVRYIQKAVLGADIAVPEPVNVPWQGVYYPGSDRIYESAADYRMNCPGYRPDRPTVGVLFYRHAWISRNMEVIDAIVSELAAQGCNALPVFSSDQCDPDTGSQDNSQVIKTYYMNNGAAVIEALIDLQSLFVITRETGKTADNPPGYELLQQLNVPIIKGLLTYGKTESEWRADPYGIAGPSLVMSVSMPECSGVIEPVIIGCLDRQYQPGVAGTLEYYLPLPQRVAYLCRRVKKWIALQAKKPSAKKIAFILHSSPCHGVELSVGSAANLDSLESVARLMAVMQREGYYLEDVPASGKELIDRIMERKAIADFRWTPVEEIVAKGGVWQSLSEAEYRRWFDRFPEAVQAKMTETWGKPPGEEKDEVPPAMVYDGRILITGVQYGNVVVCVQPKRGCAGPRCDGKVCKILHDPECPPTHQYVATYRYLEDSWGADALVHVGTHGNLEFLPGKSLGLSEACYPELTLGTVPNLYIYNTDNPAEGTIAKRRGYATLIGHMQTVMVETRAYGPMEELDKLLAEYGRARTGQPARACELETLIQEKAREGNFLSGDAAGEDFAVFTEKLHNQLSRLKNRMHQAGMHIFGQVPQGERRVNFLNAIVRHEAGDEGSLNRLVAELMGLDYDLLRDSPHAWHDNFGKNYDALLADVNQYSREFIKEFIA